MAQLLDVSVNNGKYRVIQYADGHVGVQRSGIDWRDCTGDKLVLSLAQEVEHLRERLSKSHTTPKLGPSGSGSVNLGNGEICGTGGARGPGNE